MEGVTNIKQRWSVTQAQIAHREQPECSCPRVPGLNTESMAPSVIDVELHAVPRPLTPVHLKRVVVSEALIGQIACCFASVERVSLEKVDRIAVARICAAGRKPDVPDQIAKVSGRTR